MRLPYSSDPLRYYSWLTPDTSWRIADASTDTELDAMLKYDARDIVALLCHDALFKGEARIGLSHKVPLITVLSLLSRNSGNDWVKVQGRDRLKQRLKAVLDLMPSLEEKIDAEVGVYVVMNNREFFLIVYAPVDNQMYGVVRVSLTVDLRARIRGSA